MKKKTLSFAMALSCAMTVPAQAPEVTDAWCLVNLENKDRVFWMIGGSGLSEADKRWRVLAGAALVELDDGTARLTAALVNLADASKRFSAVIELDGRVEADEPVPLGSPKIESPIVPLLTENGGSIDPTTWRYYTDVEGTLTGQDAMLGAELAIGRRGPAFQIGVGANAKDATFGASTWFTIEVVSQPDEGDPLELSRGDINGSLEICECIGGEEAFWLNYGEGTAGCDGVPSLEMLNRPLTGATPRIAIGGGELLKTCAMLWGIAPTETFLPFLGGDLLVSPPFAAGVAVQVPPGGYVFECAVPENPCIMANDLYLQIICLDDCGPTGFSMSRGMQIHVGDL